MSIVLQGSTSGSITLQEPAVAGSNTLSLPAVTATISTNVNGDLYPLTSGTAQASTSGTSIDFTGIPSWVKRVTVVFSGVSTNGTSPIQIQIGSGSITTTGYVGVSGSYVSGVSSTAYGGSGFALTNVSGAADVYYGCAVLTNLSSNSWIATINGSQTSSNRLCSSNGLLALSGVLDRVRVTTENGTDTFDAGSINILYE